MSSFPLNLLVLTPLTDPDKARVEAAFDKVYYGKLEIAPPTGGAPASVDKAVLQDVTCIFGWFLPGNVGSVSDLPHLRWHMTPSAGYDKLIKSAYYQDLMDSTRNSDGDGDGDGQDDDKEKHYRRGHMVQLTTNSGVHCYVIPSYVLAMVVNLFIRVKENFENQISHQKWDRPQGFYARELAGSTFGILGYGRIGREVARLAKAYGCNVVAATSDGRAKPDAEGAILCPSLGDPDASIPSAFFSTREEASFHAFLGQTDVLVVCLPASKNTEKMINSRTLQALKKDAVLVNIGRGEVVDTEALVASLDSGHLYGAALDVTDPEPLPDGHRLFSMPNVLITPHIAGVTTRYLERSVDVLLLNAERLRKGDKLLNSVDLGREY